MCGVLPQIEGGWSCRAKADSPSDRRRMVPQIQGGRSEDGGKLSLSGGHSEMAAGGAVSFAAGNSDTAGTNAHAASAGGNVKVTGGEGGINGFGLAAAGYTGVSVGGKIAMSAGTGGHV